MEVIVWLNVLYQKWIPCCSRENKICTLTMWNCQMFFFWYCGEISEAASISCVHCFDLSLGYLSTSYHWAQCGAWEAPSLIMRCRCCYFFHFCLVFSLLLLFSLFTGTKKKKVSLRRAGSPDSHVVYCRLTKGRGVKTVTPVTWMRSRQNHLRNTGRIAKGSERERESRGGKETQRERNLETYF